MAIALKDQIKKAVQFRRDNFEFDDDVALRLSAGLSDGLDGLIIEKFGKFILAVNYKISQDKNISRYILNALESEFPGYSILVKSRARLNSNDYFYTSNSNYDKDAIFYAREGDYKFEVHVDPRHDAGLYLDTKTARNFVRSYSAGKRVLNLFSYTCAFSIAAKVGGATEVVNIDPEKLYLDWGGRNADLNNVVVKRYVDTTQGYLARHLRRLESGKDEPYDLIICDPPAFLVGRGDERLARKMWPTWFDEMKKCKCPEFIVVINDKFLAQSTDVEKFIVDGLDASCIEKIDQGLDVVGMQGLNVQDSQYFIPLVFLVKR